MTKDYLPGLLKGLKKDLGDHAIQNALFSEDKVLQEFGLAALKESQVKRSQAYFRALEKLVQEQKVGGQKSGELDFAQVAKQWLSRSHPQESGLAEEKAEWIARQTHQPDWLNFVPDFERASVLKFLKRRQTAQLFEELAAKQGPAARKELLGRAKPESFQFVSFEIPQGGKKFEMGSPETEVGRSNDEPLHEVILENSFELQATPITEYQKALLLGEDISKLKDGGNRAATDISWDEAKELAKRMTKLDSDYEYRLPKEKEWEYAARAGTKSAYSFGDDAVELSDYAIHSGNKSADRGHDVATRKPNLAGLYDMHGNVWEWCEDLYEQGGSSRVFRGGSWGSDPRRLRSSRRDWDFPVGRNSNLGVRLSRTKRSP
jgi:hypothetical protein